MAYYYLVASLVPLTLESDILLTSAKLLETWKNLLTPQDRVDLERLINGKPESARHPSIRKWLRIENRLKNAIVIARTARLNIDPHQFLRGNAEIDIHETKVVTEAFTKQNPLEKELALDKYRWKLLDEMANDDFFGMPSIFSYVLKLKLIMRWKSLADEKGRDVIEKVFERISKEVCYGM